MRFSSNRPLVSIITPSYNQGQFVERTILSVLKQDYERIEYIFVDGASRDETASVLERYNHEFDLLIVEKDGGQADALNKGFAKAHGEVLAYLNSDDCYASPHVVSQAVNLLIENSDKDVVYGRRYYIDKAGYFCLCYPFRGFDPERLKHSCYLPQECCFWTKNIYDKAGAYIDADLHFALDYDLWFRILRANGEFLSVASLFGLFRWYAEQKTNELWTSRGIPEIATVQQRYLGRAVSEERMLQLFMEHQSGIDPNSNFSQSNLFDQVWHYENELRRQLFRFAPLDHWVFNNSPEGLESFAYTPERELNPL